MFLAIALICGCGPFTSSRPKYTIYMANRTPRDLDGVCVYYGGRMAASKGILVAGGKATYGPVTLPIPDEAEVRWIDGEVSHAPKVQLSGIVPEVRRDVNIWFIIEDDASITLKVGQEDDIDENVNLGKTLLPYHKKK